MLVAAVSALLLPDAAVGDVSPGQFATVLTLEVPVAIPISAPLRDCFGLGAMPSIAAAWPIRPWILVGLRLRAGFLSNGPTPEDPTIQDPDSGGLVSLSGVVRLRLFAGRYPESRVAGPWLECGTGPGLTGSLVRLTAEAGVGWDFRIARWKVGPAVRYLHIVQPSDASDTRDAQLVLLGLEIALRDARLSPAATATGEESPIASTAKEKVTDRDKDGILDQADKCPDEAEDKDLFEDDDGCPDLDNDKDGIADAADACPNEPETVNGVADEDGCPDQGSIVVKENRILLTEHVLFDINRSRVNADARSALAAVLNLWKQHPEWDRLIIDGYADRHGPVDYNIWLSRKRAERVHRVLVEIGFPADKLRLRAFGNRQVRVPGENEEADRANRRVEFVIVKKGDLTPQAEEPASTQPQDGEDTEP